MIHSVDCFAKANDCAEPVVFFSSESCSQKLIFCDICDVLFSEPKLSFTPMAIHVSV